MSHPTNPKYVVLAGGLTGGPVAPLLGVVDFWQQKDARIKPVIFDIAPSFGESVAAKRNIEFHKIITGKFRRHRTWINLFIPVLLIIGLIQSLYILRKLRPKIVLGAGGFVQLPVMYAAWILRIPRAIHQQDVLVTLSNRLCAPIANFVSTTFEFSIRDFPQETGLGPKYIKGTKVFWTGNPTMHEQVAKSNHKQSEFISKLNLNNELPVLLVFGGGGGAQAINDIVIKALPELTKVVQVVHITGPNKNSAVKSSNYHSMELSSHMPELYNRADLVLARAGINTLTELAEFAKPSIIVPMPNSHQELNAELIYRTKSALVLDQKDLNTEILIKAIRKIMFDSELQKSYVKNLQHLFPKNAVKNIVELIEKTLDKS